jgi:hypothetical protein
MQLVDLLSNPTRFFQEANRLCEDNQIKNDLLLLQSRHNALSRQQTLGTISYSDAGVESAKIARSMVALANQIHQPTGSMSVSGDGNMVVQNAINTQINIVGNQPTTSAIKKEEDPFASDPTTENIIRKIFKVMQGYFIFFAKHGDVLEELGAEAKEVYDSLTEMAELVVTSTDLNKVEDFEEELAELESGLTDLITRARKEYRRVNNGEVNEVLKLLADKYPVWKAFQKAYAILKDTGKANFEMPSKLPSTNPGIAMLKRKFLSAAKG